MAWRSRASSEYIVFLARLEFPSRLGSDRLCHGLYRKPSAKASCSSEVKRCAGRCSRATVTYGDRFSGHLTVASSIGMRCESVWIWTMKSKVHGAAVTGVTIAALREFSAGRGGIFVFAGWGGLHG